jgi:hypothetical protein
MSKEYPTQADVEEHTQQLVRSIRAYLRNVGTIPFVKSSFQSLFTDLLLEIKKEGCDHTDRINFDDFLKESGK